jgi:LPPG:FO 2-phospho-L-lactate transferase
VADRSEDGLRVVCLAGGVGGAKLADGLSQLLGSELIVIVNSGDDFERHSLAIWPDHDTVLYTLAGLADPVQGWGLADETWNVLDALSGLGEDTWFRLGDRDIATHLYRTDRLRRGARPTEVALELAAALGIASTILPMTDEPVRTRVRTDDGWLDFQDYFVRLRQQPEVHDVIFGGIQLSRLTPEAEAALTAADVIVVAPSNPIVSIGPIVAVPGMLEAIRKVRGAGAAAVGVSGIVGSKALRGPADRMLVSLGEEASALGVARRYASAGLLDGFVVDQQDTRHVEAIEALGLVCEATDTIMAGRESRVALARFALDVAAGITARKRSEAGIS